MRKTWVNFARVSSLVVLTLFTIALSTPQASAQQATAQVTGKVQDPSGAIVVGAEFTLTNSNTGVSRKTTSNKDGDYLFTLVPIGTYQLSVRQKGFQRYEQKGITLEINQNAKVDIALQVGATTEVVEVNSNATQVDTQSATLGKVESEQRILSLPLVERDTMQLGLLQAGVFVSEQAMKLINRKLFDEPAPKPHCVFRRPPRALSPRVISQASPP